VAAPVSDASTAELKEEVQRLQQLCDKYQRELMTSRAELRQRHSSSTGAAAASADTPSKSLRDGKKKEEMYSLAVVLLVAMIAFLVGVIFF
jgi:hypothetical protein